MVADRQAGAHCHQAGAMAEAEAEAVTLSTSIDTLSVNFRIKA